MKRIGNRAKILCIVIIYFMACSGMFAYRYIVNATTWVQHPANKNIYKNGELLSPGRIEMRDGTMLYEASLSGRKYNDDKKLRMATLHTVGDAPGVIGTGLLNSQRLKFIGYDFLNGVYAGNDSGTTIGLTLDRATCLAAYNALGSHKGTVGVYNYKTGEIVCMVSTPTYDPTNVPDFKKDSEKYDGVYINRLLRGLYTPGSVFKIVTAAAAIETVPDIYERTFECKGHQTIGGEKVNCSGTHGKQSFKKAFENSCNSAFAQIALLVGAETLEKYVGIAGVRNSYTVDGATTSAGRFDIHGAADVNIAWAGIGQYTDLCNPYQFMVLMGAIAGEGKAKSPYFIESIASAIGVPTHINLNGSESRTFPEQTANLLKSLMRGAVETEYGDKNFKDMKVCAKTGTAEVAGKKPTAWFTGFSDDPQTPLAFVVVVEDSGSGVGVAMPVAKKVMTEAVKLYK